MKYVLVDCFDTIFHRKNSNESTLYDWAREMSRVIDNNVSSFELYNTRKQVGASIMNMEGKEEFSYFEVIEIIYEKYKSKLKKIDLESFHQKCYEIDIAIEKKELYLDKNNFERIKKLKLQGNKIVLVSDFYMPKSFFVEIFRYFELENLIDDFFISSEIGFRKSTGNLYKYIIDYYGVNARDFIMIGDNELSDIEMASKYKIETIHVPFENKISRYNNKRTVKNAVKKALYVKCEDDLFKGFGSGILLFCDRLYKNVIDSDCKCLLFCSREGQLLKQIFDKFQNEFCVQDRVRTEYFYVSRRATLLPSLKKLSLERFDRIFRQYRELTVNDFLFSIGFTQEEIVDIATEEERNAKIYNSKESEAIRKILENEKFTIMYEKKRSCQNELCKKYIEAVNGDLEKLYIVDVGWKGTIQDNLYEILEEKCDIQGFYFGVYGYNSSERNRKKGLMFDLEQFCETNDIFSYNHIKLESVFVADHGAVQSYEKVNDFVVPYLNQSDNLELYNKVAPYQSKLIKGVDQIISIIKNSPFSIQMLQSFLTKEYLYFQCIKMPRYRRVFDEIKMVTIENFGNISGNKEKIPQVNNNIHRKQSAKFMYIYAVYNILDKIHLKKMYPIAWLYCLFVYWFKGMQIIGKVSTEKIRRGNWNELRKK